MSGRSAYTANVVMLAARTNPATTITINRE
jgi:hypothetical protein